MYTGLWKQLPMGQRLHAFFPLVPPTCLVDAKYCTMSPWKWKERFPGHPLSVCSNDLGIQVIWCVICVMRVDAP